MPSKKLIDLTNEAHDRVREAAFKSRKTMKQIASAALMKCLKPDVKAESVRSLVKRYS